MRINKIRSACKIVFLNTLLMLIAQTHTFSQCWSLAWSDEFDGTSLDLTKWNYDIGTGCPSLCGWGNNEKEYYTDNTDNVSVSDGYLNITAKYAPNYLNSGADFTSGKIHTRNKHDWLYGRFEARIKLAQGTGLWPAFWMLPSPGTPYGGWPTSGEIDIMENRGDQTTTVTAALHYGNPSPNNQYDGSSYVLSSGNFMDEFHVFALEWEPGAIRWYVDDILFKTETENPYTLNPPSNNAVTWPWDQNFYIILNLAVGGWYPGNPSTATITGGDDNYSRTMQIDYVRVYTDLSAGGFTGTLAGRSAVLLNETDVAYTIPDAAEATYVWTVTGGNIAEGQGSNSINVDWGTTDGLVSVEKTLPCGSGTYEITVTVQPTHCGIVHEDFESVRHPKYGFIHGVFTEKIANPAPSAENTSPFCSRYIRNPGEQWDVLILENFSVGNADDYERRIKRFMMDVYSNGAGRVIELVLENSSVSLPNNYPTGRHSVYRATTSAVNTWETLEFEYITSPDGPLAGTSVDQLTILCMPNTYTSHTFYFDNLISSYKPKTAAISGASSVCEDQTGVQYSVTNTQGSDYAWTVPDNATITSGSTGPNNNSVSVSFGSTVGNISVIETNITGCTGEPVIKEVSLCFPAGIQKSALSLSAAFPNPTSQHLTVQVNEDLKGKANIIIVDKLGRIIRESDLLITSDLIELDVAALPAGMYVLHIKSEERTGTTYFLKK